MTLVIDIGDRCTHCGGDTSIEADRIPSGADGRLVLTGGDDLTNAPSIDVDLNGWMCVQCQLIECDHCGKMTLDYTLDGTVICSDCKEKKEVN